MYNRPIDSLRPHALGGFLSALIVVCALMQPVSVGAEPRVINVSPTYVDFGPIKVGATATVPVTFRNLTDVQLQIAGGAISGSTEFRGLGGTCSGGVLPPNDSCSINYHFRPTAAGQDFTASTIVFAGADGVGGTQQTLRFAGSGTESLLQLSPLAVDFGTQQIGAMVEVRVVATNTHDETVSFGGGGGLEPPFSGATTCGGGLAPGNTCEFIRTFTPSGTAPAEDSTTLATAATNIYETYSLNYSGDGSTESGIVTFHPRGIDFGRIKLGRTVTFDFIARNISAGNVTFGGGGVGDTAGGAFSGAGTTCGGTIAPGAECKFAYRFQPRVLGPVSTATAIDASGSGQSQGFQIHLAGSGIGTLAQVTPTDIDFGDVLIGTLMNVAVTVTNTSESPLTGFVGGNVSAPFSAINACPSSLDVGASCQITYRFHPGEDTIGPNATQTVLSFTNATGVRPNIAISLTGTGYDFDRIFANGFD